MIPRVIYTFWDGPRNVVVECCLRDLEAANRDCEVVRLSGRDVPHTPGLGNTTKPCHIADWARIWYLSRNGGVWLDASCMCPGPVGDWVDFASGCIQGFQARWDTNILENWAFACPPGSPFMEAWAREFAFAMAIGFDRYKEVRKRVLPATVYSRMPYLTMHGAFCVVRRQFPDACVRMRSSIDDGPLSYLHDRNDNSLRAVLDIPLYCGRVPFVKLRGPERRALQSILAARSAFSRCRVGVLLLVIVATLVIAAALRHRRRVRHG